MPSVTVPGMGQSHVAVPITASDVSYVVAQQIASTLNSLWPTNLQVEIDLRRRFSPVIWAEHCPWRVAHYRHQRR